MIHSIKNIFGYLRHLYCVQGTRNHCIYDEKEITMKQFFFHCQLPLVWLGFLGHLWGHVLAKKETSLYDILTKIGRHCTLICFPKDGETLE